jgi:hypothetical protein
LTLSPLTGGGSWKVIPAALASIRGDKLTALSSLSTSQPVQVIYTLTNTAGCSLSDTAEVTLNALPKASDFGFEAELPDGTVISGGNGSGNNGRASGSVCTGSEVILRGSGASSSWELGINAVGKTVTLNDGASESTIRINTDTPLDLISLKDNETGCVSSLSKNNASDGDLLGKGIDIIVKAAVQITSSPVGGGICLPNGTIDLTVEASSDAADNLSYVWTNIANPADTLGTDAVYRATAGGIYRVKVSGCNADSASAVVTEDLPLIVQKRNHTLLINNNTSTNGSNYEFVYYKWYKNDQLLKVEEGGEEGSFKKGGYYYTGSSNLDFDAEYWAILKDASGKEYRTCPYVPVVMSVPANIQAYPNPAVRGNTLVTVDAEVNDEGALAGATIDIYSPSGAFLGRVPATGRYTQVSLPSVSGVYILFFKSEEITKEIKIIVE